MTDSPSLDLTGYRLFSSPPDVRSYLRNVLTGEGLEYFDVQCRSAVLDEVDRRGFRGGAVLYRFDHDLAEYELRGDVRLGRVNEVRRRIAAILLENGVGNVVRLEQDAAACVYRQTVLPDHSYTAQLKGWGVVSESPELVVKVSMFVPPTQRVARPWAFNHPDIAQEKSFQLADYQGWATVAPRQDNMQTLEDILESSSLHERLQRVSRAMGANLFMHTQGFVHGDIKPANIDSSGRLFDLEDTLPNDHPEFGLWTLGYSEATYYHDLVWSFKLPECTYKKDVFCWGITLLQVLLGIGSPEAMSSLMQGNLRKYKDREKALHSSIEESLKPRGELSAFIPLLKAMTRRSSSRRPDLKRVLAVVRKTTAQVQELN